MKNKLLLIVQLILILFLTVEEGKAQDPFYTQFFNMPLHLNPSTVGLSGLRMNAAAIYKRQWNPLGGGYNTFSASIDYASTKNMNFGMIITNDQIARGALNTSSVQLIAGYANTIPNVLTFSFGGQFGFYDRKANLDNITFVDEILFQNSFANEFSGTQSAFYSNFSTGGMITSRFGWLGASWHNMAPMLFGGRPIVYTKTSNLLIQENIESYGKLSLHGGLEYGLPSVDYFSGFTMFNWRKQGPARQFDILSGIKFNEQYKNLMVGVGYRSIFWPGDPIELSDRDAINFFISMDFDINSTVFRVSYSYDLTVSGLSAFSGGSHEGAIVTGTNGFNAQQEKQWENWVERHRVVCPLAYNRGGTSFKFNDQARNRDKRISSRRVKKKNKSIKKGRKRR